MEENMPTCKKCQYVFPNRQKINGKVRILKSRRFCLKCSPWGKHNTKNLSKQATKPICSICKKIMSKKNRRRRREKSEKYYSYCKPCAVKKQYIRQLNFKQQAINYLGGKCNNCGYNKCNAALCFHHLIPGEKDVGIAKLRSHSFTKIKPELDKCVLLCSNCHAEEHYGGHKKGLHS